MARWASVNSISAVGASVSGADRRGGTRPAVPAADRSGPRPRDLTDRQQLVEHGGLIVADTLTAYQRRDRGRRDGNPGQLVDHRGQAVDTRAVRRPHMLPRRQESGIGGGAHRLDLRPQRRQRPAAQILQHVGVAPLIAISSVGELAAHQPTVDGQPAQHIRGDPHNQPEPGRRSGRGERPVGAGMAEQFAERVGDGRGEARRYADRHRHADAVAQQVDIFDGDPPGLPGERRRERAFGGPQSLQPPTDVGHGASVGDLRLGQRTQNPQQIGDALRVARRPLRAEMLQLPAG